jgi:Ni/Co efflux regulator RcnB
MRDRDRGRGWFNPDRYPREFHAERRFHVRPYLYPRGWYDRDWFFGDYLPFGWFGPSYYLDWGYFDLPPPPIGCEWVRVGPDALLVDVWSGEVLSVEHGIFW